MMRRPFAMRRHGLRGGWQYPTAAPFNPLDDDTDLVLWLDGIDSPRSVSDAVDQVNDLSTVGAHATSTGTNRPTYSASALTGGYPGFVFDGTNDWLQAPIGAAVNGASGVTVFMVCQDTRASGTGYWLEYGLNGGAVAGTFAFILGSGVSGGAGFYVRGNVGQNFWRSDAGKAHLGLPRVVSMSADLSAAAASEVAPLRLDGVAISGSQTGANENASTFVSRVLNIGAQTTGGSAMPGVMSAIMVFKRAMSDADKARVEQYLGARYGLPFANISALPSMRVLWAGQSNSMGQLPGFTAIEEYDETQPSPPWIYGYKDFHFSSAWNTSTWGPLTENPVAGWEGPDLVMASWLMRVHGYRPDVIACMRGSTSLGSNWLPGSGPEWDRMVNTTWPTAVSTHPSPPSNPIPWFVWIQGESDSANATYASDYETNLTALISSVRGLSGMSAAKVVIAKLHPSCSLGTAGTIADIRAAQDAVAAADVIGAYTVETSDLALQGDSLHYTEAAAITLGQRIADTIAANT